ncbi:hydrolase, alpha/beta fold family protein [Alkalihalophilus pseudofirmus OF4]|uniref:Hydrolase, alpha/beta fold family protein n=1 Tax=Alkalihalophilus pseudofirmus (strain ATCC BAA-2126 / JCM 17055 / OF4) TaxID=398511 RepID=D3FQR7_ALKPO|nr:alpha/beta fold hydrolase [Alkalihalophilus pseudofirmus]ADC51437.1 hydrolase, alpha/beta fold family protein [Alkalihalophilus pseudofirmus OF4]
MWEQKLINTERGEFEVFVAGSGEPLCVTHLYSEFNERGNYFADMFVNSFSVFLVNLKEAGNSPRVKNGDELSLSATSKDLEAIRRALGFERWSFAGHSTGGMLGLVYAAKHSSSLKRLMVGGATATKEYMEHKSSIYSFKNPLNETVKELLSILKSSDSTKEQRIQAGREWTEMSLYEPRLFDEYFSKPSSGKVVQKRLDYYINNELPTYDIRDHISHTNTPTIVFCGRYDSQCPFVYSEEIHNLLPNSKLYVFETSNHFPHLEEKERFCEMVEDFNELE